MNFRKRQLLFAMASLLGFGNWPLARAGSAEAQLAISKILNGQPVEDGGILLDIPPLIENGNSVPVRVEVLHPMVAPAYIRAIHIVAEENPLPNVISVYLSPQLGKARLATRIRLATTQRVWAIAQTSEGKFLRTYANTTVTLAACFEG